MRKARKHQRSAGACERSHVLEHERDLFSFWIDKKSDGSTNSVSGAEQHHDVLGFENGGIGRGGMGDPGTHEGHDGCPGP